MPSLDEMIKEGRAKLEAATRKEADEVAALLTAARALADRDARVTRDQHARGLVRRDNAERFVIVVPHKPRELRWRITKHYVDRWTRALLRLGVKFEIYERAADAPRGDPYTWDLRTCTRVYPQCTSAVANPNPSTVTIV